MIIETKSLSAKTWKRTNVLRRADHRPDFMAFEVLDAAIMRGAHNRLWRIDGVEYETRVTNGLAQIVYVCEVHEVK